MYREASITYDEFKAQVLAGEGCRIYGETHIRKVPTTLQIENVALSGFVM